MIYTFAIIFSILFVFCIIMLVRNNKLEEKYSILWIIFSVVIIILALNKGLLDSLANLVGIFYAPAMLFLVACIFIILFIIHLSMVVTKQNKQIIKLVQEVGILKEKMKDDNNKKDNK